MNLYVGQEIPIPYNHCNIIVTEIVEHKNKLTARAKHIENTNYPDVFIRIEDKQYYFIDVREDLEDCLPTLIFDINDDYFLRILLSFYGDLFKLKGLTIEIIILVIESKEDYLYHYGGVIIGTFNTNINKIDEALKREGRLKDVIEIGELEDSKVEALKKEFNITNEGKTLAKLFNSRESNYKSQNKKIGF